MGDVDQAFREMQANEKFDPLSAGALHELRLRQEREVEAVSTGFESWDKASRGEGGGKGLALGWYALLCGMTGAGKTLLMLNLVAQALRDGVDVLVFSLEMSWEQLATRLRPIVTGEDVTHVEWGDYYRAEKAKVADQAIVNLPGTLYVNYKPIWRLDDIGAVMEAHRRDHDVRLFVVDYAQLVEPSGQDSRLFEKMGDVSSALRYHAKALDCVCIALSQLNRTTTRDRGVGPTVDGLFGSSRFGFDADQVLALDFSRRENDPVTRTERTWLKLLKNRHGPQVDIPVQLDKSTLRFREALPHEEDAWPGA